MASDRQRYTLSLVLRDEDGRIKGELELTLLAAAKVEVDGRSEGTDRGSSDPPRDSQDHRTNRAPSRPFRGRDERPTEARNDRREMSQEQRKFLFRLAYQLGAKGEDANEKVLDALGVERFKDATREMASKAIDRLKTEIADEKRGRRGANGAAHHG